MALATLLALTLAPSLAPAPGDDWPHLRGPRLDGSADGCGELGEGPLAMDVLWTAPVGSAYSGVAVAGDLVATLGGDGSVDQVIALRAADGAELWRADLGPIYLGHDGSEDGPISSPVLAYGLVYAIGPRGLLMALDEESGDAVWSIDLVEDLGAPVPEYGFTTTPLIEGELVVVQAAAPGGRLLCAFDARTGEPRWTAGEGAPGYQSPVAMDLAGRRQIVVLNGGELLGVAPGDGAVLWSHTLGGERDDASTGVATPLGGSRFACSVSGSLAAYEVAHGEYPADDGELVEGYLVTELYRSRDLGRTYAAPVLHGDHLYGYRGDILTCVDAGTGARAWRSRPPGGMGLIAVDARLFVFGAQGVLAAIAATPEGYREDGRVQALEQSSYTWPSFSAGRVYVRNHSELACVRVATVGEAVAAAAPASSASDVPAAPPGSAFARFLDELRGAEDKPALVEAFLAEQPSFPILEGDLVHFVFRGEVEDAALVGNMVDGSRPDPLHRVEGTDFHHRTYRIEPGARWEYQFVVDYGERRVDPLNPRTAPAPWGDMGMSVVATPGYEEQDHFLEPAGEERGRIEEIEFVSEQLGNTRALKVYLPHGYDQGDATYPLLLVHQGPDWIERGQLVNTLDNVIGDGVRPLVAVFITQVPRWWHEGGGTGTDVYVDMLATELVPHLAGLYRISSDPADRAVMGKASFGMTALLAALEHPDVFGKAGVQSLALNDVAKHDVLRELEEGERRPVSFYLDWNRYEARNSDRGYDFGEHSRRVWDLMEERGYPVAGGEALDGSGWGSWRARSDDLLRALFPAE